MTIRWRWFWLPIVLAFWLGGARSARADTDVELQVSSAEISVGETLDVQLDAMSSDDQEPSAPALQAPNVFEVRGPSVGSRQQVSINGFHMVRQVGISASWQLTATRAGVYTLGPASVLVAGRRQQSQTVQIRVLPEGQGRPRRGQNSRGRRSPGFNPFDPFGTDDAFDDLFDRMRGARPGNAQLPAAPPGLVPARPLDPTAFLDARVEPQHAVVGQQVTLSIYAHGSEGLFQEGPGSHEPATPDFLSQRLIEDGSRQPIYQYERDGQRWIAVKVREFALFPIRAGQLEVGPLEFGFLGRRYGVRNGLGLMRKSHTLTVDVSEPPAAGKPPGYAGDVGDFSLGAVVEPRRIGTGGSIAVTAYVKGTGRLPGSLKLPEQAGVEWLEPTLHDENTTSGSTIGGSRTFSYVVKMTRPGVIDLGNLTLSFYSPSTGHYRVVPMALGRVTVDPPAPGAASAGPNAASPRSARLSELVKFRSRLEAPRQASFWADRPGFFWLLGAGPLLVVISALAWRGAQSIRRRVTERGESQAQLAQRALSEARQALSRADLGSVATVSERALYLGIEWATGVRARALMRSELGARLSAAGLPESLAAEAGDLLERCSELRRGTAAGAGADAGAKELLARVQDLVKRLVRRTPARPTRSSEELRV